MPSVPGGSIGGAFFDLGTLFNIVASSHIFFSVCPKSKEDRGVTVAGDELRTGGRGGAPKVGGAKLPSFCLIAVVLTGSGIIVTGEAQRPGRRGGAMRELDLVTPRSTSMGRS